MRHLSPRRINLKNKDIKPVEIGDVDFDTDVYSDDELNHIFYLVNDEIARRRKTREDLETLELKARYEGNWIIDRGNLYYILEISDTYRFKYIYLCRDTSDLMSNSLPNFEVGLDIGHGDFLSNFSEEMKLLDPDEAGAMITKFKEDLNIFIEKECN